MTVDSHAKRAQSFNAAAAQYAENRPSYPPALFDAIEELAGRSLTGARVADIGAGTGIATALLRARGADVIAVEPGDGMAAQFRRTLPDVPLVRGDGNSLPLATASVDFLTYAQSWHWTRPALSVPEALRVLRPGGALALWWNMDPHDVPWVMEQAERVRQHFNGRHSNKQGASDTRATDSFEGAPVVPAHAHRVVRWSRTVPLDTHLANLSSHSIFLLQGEEATNAFLAREREHLLRTFPDATVEEVYDVLLILATR
ncbi:class I SAM-dependent methyltransferase [Streptomyces sp. HUAS ZL42]|uniref:class I SAM-dependent methyltransferase n=1 Tax=Streptomyces sp. HUAS ZL42 TaxID=3231715 RepID=UPI00345E172F